MSWMWVFLVGRGRSIVVDVGNRLDCVRDVIIYVFIMLADLTRSY